MTTEELKEYLEITVDMERNLYLLENTRSQLIREKEPLGHRRVFQKPVEREKQGVCGIVISAIAVAFIGAIVGLFFGMAVPGALIGALLGALAGTGIAKDVNKTSRKAYEAAYMSYDKQVKEDETRVQKENAKKAYLDFALKKVEAQLEQSRENLKKIYEKGVIYPKYRYMVAVCSFYEYICSGRCSGLMEKENSSGAYNLYELEARLDKIITQLNIVITQLERIKQYQFVLYTELQESNRRSAELLDATNKMSDRFSEQISGIDRQLSAVNLNMKTIESQAAITAYNTERAAKELQYLNRMKYLSGDFDKARMM